MAEGDTRHRYATRARTWAAGRTLVAALLLLAITAIAARAQTLEIPYTVTKPAGNGPFPVVVLLHDCSGLGPRSSGAPWRWSSELMRLGYVTIWPDSFSTRGFPSGVCTEPQRAGVGGDERAADAYAALAYARTLPFVDPRRIAVMGGSHGGGTTLAAIVASDANQPRGLKGFVGAIALYPGCGRSYGDWKARRDGATWTTSGIFKPLAPTLILVGALDDWTPAEPCQRMVDAAKAAGQPVDIKVYPGAHHSFDSIGPVRFNADRINVSAPTRRGATTGGNPEAWADARLMVRDFLAKVFAPTGR